MNTPLGQTVLWIFCLFALVGPPVTFIVGWVAIGKGFFEPKWRAWITLLSHTAVTLQGIAYICALFHLHSISGEADSVNFWLNWAGINYRIAIAIILLASLGKGLARISSILCAVSLHLFSVYVDMLR